MRSRLVAALLAALVLSLVMVALLSTFLDDEDDEDNPESLRHVQRPAGHHPQPWLHPPQWLHSPLHDLTHRGHNDSTHHSAHAEPRQVWWSLVDATAKQHTEAAQSAFRTALEALPQRQRLALVLQWYHEPSAARRSELQEALLANARLATFETILLLHEFAGVDTVSDLFRRTGSERLGEQLPAAARATLQAVYIGHAGRVNVSDALAIANDRLLSFVVVLANSDIAFDASVKLLQADPLLSSMRLAYFLSRWEHSDALHRPSMCSPSYQGSHDAVVFSPPLPVQLVENTAFPIGSWGYENRIIYEFETLGFSSMNPFHHHHSGIKSDQLSLRVNEDGRSRYVRPSYHPLDPVVPVVAGMALDEAIVAEGAQTSNDETDAGAVAAVAPHRVHRSSTDESAAASSRERLLLDYALPWATYLDVKAIAQSLRRAKLGAVGADNLCAVPSHLKPLVHGFCDSYGRPGVYTWNCTHLPCSLLAWEEPKLTDCVVARVFRYRCQRYATFWPLWERTAGTSINGSQDAAPQVLSVFFDGRFRVDASSFFPELAYWRHPSSVWLYEFAGESLRQHPFAGEPSVLGHFNWTMGYDKTVFKEQTLRFLEGELADYVVNKPVDELVRQWQVRPHNMLFLSSNCRDTIGRVDIVKKLMDTVPVDSLGKCLHNRELKDVLTEDELLEVGNDREAQRLVLLSKYKFVVAIENSMAKDYITEKLWGTLREGAIPLYLGAPNVHEYLPHPDAAILFSSFSSPQQVGSYVDKVLGDPALQAKHLAWHSAGLSLKTATVTTAINATATASATTTGTSPSATLSKWFKHAFTQRTRADLSSCGVCHRLHGFLEHHPLHRLM